VSEKEYIECIEHKGRKISPTPYKLNDTGEWNVHVTIITQQGNEDIVQQFSAKNTYSLEEEAKFHSIEFGKQIVDGKYPEYKLA